MPKLDNSSQSKRPQRVEDVIVKKITMRDTLPLNIETGVCAPPLLFMGLTPIPLALKKQPKPC